MEWGLRTDIRGMSWSHLGVYDISLIELLALSVVVAAGLRVLLRRFGPIFSQVTCEDEK
jgi:hypothetical protein